MINSCAINFNHKAINFGSIEKDVTGKHNNLIYRNNTMPYRLDLPVRKVIKDISERKTAPKIYCYACSDGSEPYTIALELIKRFGEHDAQKFFPIIARDIDRNAIRIAKSKKIGLDLEEANYVKSRIGNKLFSKFFSRPHKCKEKDFGRETYYTIKEGLANCVDFQVGDITHDSQKINYNNSVILCRNVWPYLENNSRENLLKTFKKKFTELTTLVVGELDLSETEQLPYGVGVDLYDKAKLVETSPQIFKIANRQNSTKSMLDALYSPLYNIAEFTRRFVISFKYGK